MCELSLSDQAKKKSGVPVIPWVKSGKRPSGNTSDLTIQKIQKVGDDSAADRPAGKAKRL